MDNYSKQERKKKNKEYYLNNKDKIRKKRDQWYKNPKNKKKSAIKSKLYRENNLEKYLKTKRAYESKKRKENLGFKLKQNISCLIGNKLRGRSLSKNRKSTFDFLPYTVDELIKHIEKQFQPGMSWANRAKWHIDHIKPDSSFNYKTVKDKEFQECWALKNLQPLWAKDNLIKSNKYEQNKNSSIWNA